jgi:DNA polymerase III epsilon subunit-like protein
MKILKRTPLRILDFDTECRPMHYSEWRPESQFTAIAWSWVGEDAVRCIVLAQDLNNERDMLEQFLADYEQADIVTGHYIRKHDLPLLVDHCIRAGLPLPKSILTQDTMDLPKVKGLGKSQENLSTELGVIAGKYTMNGSLWREANTLSAEGQATARKRVTADVLQHKQLRAELLSRGLLRAPKRWHP